MYCDVSVTTVIGIRSRFVFTVGGILLGREDGWRWIPKYCEQIPALLCDGPWATAAVFLWQIPLRQEYLRETAERHCSMSNLYVLNKASSLEPGGRS